jgi:hypothetical protein
VSPADGQGCSRWNSHVTSRDRYSLAEGAPAAIATAIATVHETSFGAARISTSASRSSIPPADRDDRLGSRICGEMQDLLPGARELTRARGFT